MRQVVTTMTHIVESAGVNLGDTLRLVAFVTDIYRYRPLANRLQKERSVLLPLHLAD